MSNLDSDQGAGADHKIIMKKIRQGFKQELSFKVGGYDCPCRILTATEEANAMSKGKEIARKTPANADKKMAEAIAVQKEVLFAGTTIGLEHNLSKEVLDKLTSVELSRAYDKYSSEVSAADPEFELLPLDKIDEIISSVKKKKATWKDFYISDLAAVGRYFLDKISPKGNEPGY